MKWTPLISRAKTHSHVTPLPYTSHDWFTVTGILLSPWYVSLKNRPWINVWRRTHEYRKDFQGYTSPVMSHMNDSCQAYKWAMSHIRMCHASHMNESCPTHTWQEGSWQKLKIHKLCYTYGYILPKKFLPDGVLTLYPVFCSIKSELMSFPDSYHSSTKKWNFGSGPLLCQRFRMRREETACKWKRTEISLVFVTIMLHVLTYVVSKKSFWNWNSFVWFVSQEVWFDKGFVIWNFRNYCLVQILSLWSLSIGVQIIFTTNKLVDRIKNLKWNASPND